MILIEIVTNVGVWPKGHRQLVSENHWLAHSGYARVVERDVPDPDAVRPTDDATDRVGVARRRPRKAVSNGTDSAESGRGPAVRPERRSDGRDESGARGPSWHEAHDAPESGASVGKSEA